MATYEAYEEVKNTVRAVIEMNNAERGVNIKPEAQEMLVDEYARLVTTLGIPFAVITRILLDAKRSKLRLCTRSIEEAWNNYCESLQGDSRSTSDIVKDQFKAFKLFVEGALCQEMQAFCYKLNHPEIYWRADAEWKNGIKKGKYWQALRDFMNGNGYKRSKWLKDAVKECREWEANQKVKPVFDYSEYVRKTGDDRISVMAKTCHALLSMVQG